MRYATESVHPILLPQNRTVNTVRGAGVESRKAGFQFASSSAKTSAASAPTAQSCLEILPAARRCFRRLPENTPAGDHLVKGWEPRPNARDEKPRRTDAANTPLRAGDQLGESGLNVWVGNWPFNLRRVPIECVDFVRADIPHDQRRIVRGQAKPNAQISCCQPKILQIY